MRRSSGSNEQRALACDLEKKSPKSRRRFSTSLIIFEKLSGNAQGMWSARTRLRGWRVTEIAPH